MSSPSRYWDDEELNSAVLNELAAIEPRQVASTSEPTVRKPSPASPSKKPQTSRGSVQQRKSPTRPVNRKPKKWDHTTFAKTGRRRKAGRGKGKENQDEERDEEEVVEFEQFPEPSVPGKLIAQVSNVTYIFPMQSGK